MQQLFSELRFRMFPMFPFSGDSSLFFLLLDRSPSPSPIVFFSRLHSFYFIFHRTGGSHVYVIAWTKHNFRFLELIVKEAQRVLKEINFFAALRPERPKSGVDIASRETTHKRWDAVRLKSAIEDALKTSTQAYNNNKPNKPVSFESLDLALAGWHEVVTSYDSNSTVCLSIVFFSSPKRRRRGEKRNYKNKFQRFYFFTPSSCCSHFSQLASE